MNNKTIEQLIQINNDFYQSQAASFSQTRQSAWQGWRRCADALRTCVLDADASTATAGAVSGVSLDTQASVPHSLAASSLVGVTANMPVRVLDVACGNLRFEAFLQAEFPQVNFDFWPVDNCDDLVEDACVLHEAARGRRETQTSVNGNAIEHENVSACGNTSECGNAGIRGDERAQTSTSETAVHFQNFDVVQALVKRENLSAQLQAPACDMAVAFGFMHHVPTHELRAQVLQMLVDKTRPGGIVAVSFWCFMRDKGLAARALTTHEQAIDGLAIDAEQLDAGDYLLGWKNLSGAWRYCHNFEEEEIEKLVDTLGARVHLIDQFSADGRSGNLNTYVMLQVCA